MHERSKAINNNSIEKTIVITPDYAKEIENLHDVMDQNRKKDYKFTQNMCVYVLLV
jgi:hypothetical protein